MSTAPTHRSRALVALAVVAAGALPAGARPAAAQALAGRYDVGVFAGSTTPQGRIADFATTGVHVGALVERRLLAPWLAVRAEAAFHQMVQPAGAGMAVPSSVGTPLTVEPNDPLRVVIGALNAVVQGPRVAGAVRPYAVGGIGVHRATGHSFWSVPSPDESDWKVGVSGGVGLAVPLRAVTPFVEARYHRMYATHVSTRLVPVSVGVRF